MRETADWGDVDGDGQDLPGPCTPRVPDPSAVHLWTFSLDCKDLQPEFLACLSQDEIARRDRFRFPIHQRRYNAGRATLRQILGKYLGVPASEVPFTYEPWGKPRLDAPFDAKLVFNLSHSDHVAAVAVASEGRIGVDVERVRSDFSLMDIADIVFTAAQKAHLAELEGAGQTNQFFRYWTRNEALLKAQGTGFLAPLSSAVHDWPVYEFEPAPGYAGAVAVEQGAERIDRFHWGTGTFGLDQVTLPARD